MSRGRKAFTLIEALVAVALVAVGVTAVMGALGNITRNQALGLEREQMQRLALQKYEELVSTGEYTTSSNGDFNDRNITNYQWDTTLDATGVENLQAFRVRVYKTRQEDQFFESFTGLVFRAPAAEEAQ